MYEAFQDHNSRLKGKVHVKMLNCKSINADFKGTEFITQSWEKLIYLWTRYKVILIVDAESLLGLLIANADFFLKFFFSTILIDDKSIPKSAYA